MSYCVNCGVELDRTCSVCPLCNTKVINPNEPVDTVSAKPYPSRTGQIDPVKRGEAAILMGVILATTAIVCGLLNLLLFNGSSWSLYIIGICIVLWIFLLPVLFPSKLPIYIILLLDGIIIDMYFGIIAWLHPGNGWYYAITLPLILFITALVEVYAFFLRHPRSSILSNAVIFVAEVGLLTTTIELLVRHYLDNALKLSWSAVVLTCCIIIDATLITILRRTHLREEVRRRMHI